MIGFLGCTLLKVPVDACSEMREQQFTTASGPVGIVLWCITE